MDNVENKSVPPPESNEWRARYDSLHHLILSIMLLLIVVSGTLWMFLQRQVKYTSLDLDERRPFITQYEKTTGPAMDTFINKLAEYGRTHPDFVPILTRYGIKPAGTPANGAATSAPAAAPAKKN